MEEQQAVQNIDAKQVEHTQSPLKGKKSIH